jgi:hypothetical protein
MDKRIVYTRLDGGVSVCCPTDWIISVMCNGGGIWDHLPPGVMDRQIASMVGRGVNEDAAHRYAKAAMWGGCTTAEALEIIRDRDCAHLGTAIELWDKDDVPTDRWFRDAWRRSHNGGPISIDLAMARPIQWRHIRAKLIKENKNRDGDMLNPIEIDADLVKTKIRQARDEMELRQVWPEELRSA